MKEFPKVVILAALVAITLCLLGCGGHGGGGGDAGRKPQGYDARELAAEADVISKAAKESSIKGNVEFWVKSHYEIRQDIDLAPTKVTFTREDRESSPYTFEGTVSFEDDAGQEWVADWSMQVEVDSEGNFESVPSSDFFGEPQIVS